MRIFKGECAHFRFNKCPIYTHDGANVKFSANSQETDYSAWVRVVLVPWTADADTLRTPAGGPVHNPAGLVH